MSHLIFELPGLAWRRPSPPGDQGSRPDDEARADGGPDAEHLSLCRREPCESSAPGAGLIHLSLTRCDPARDDPRRELARLSLAREERPEPAADRWM